VLSTRPRAAGHAGLPVFPALQREKEASGLADVPGGSKGKLLEVEYAFTEDRKLRGQLRDPSAIEAQVSLCVLFGCQTTGNWAAACVAGRDMRCSCAADACMRLCA
jgi:hypothetical protein